jgi:hypothetical protein
MWPVQETILLVASASFLMPAAFAAFIAMPPALAPRCKTQLRA